MTLRSTITLLIPTVLMAASSVHEFSLTTIDGKPAPVAKADYVLRALLVPAGKHTIEFKFEASVFHTGSNLTAIAGWIILLLILGYIVWLVRPMINKNKPVEKPAVKK